ncbi:MAG: DUF2142 domain-containing protein [Candidatus Hydrogenedentes bacterium]|nr:DUF2142 domain-containing protein [Candidatus Hydrogenedentota bacterium]
MSQERFTPSSTVARGARRLADAADAHPEAYFAVLAALFGIAAALLTPPLFGVTLDEPNHFMRVYHISELNLSAEKRGDSVEDVGGEVPSSVKNLFRRICDYYPAPPDRKFNAADMLELLGDDLNPRERSFGTFANTAPYTPVPYAPAACGVAARRFFGLSPSGLVYAGRLCNLAVWTFLVFLAVRAMPCMKRLLVLLALTPVSLGLAASLSPDALTNAAAFLLLAHVTRCAFGSEPTLTRRDLQILCLLASLLLLGKQGYLPLCLTILMIPPARFGERHRHRRFLALYATLVCSVFGLTALYARRVWVPFMPGTAETSDQIRRLLTEPTDFLGLFIRSLAYYCSTPDDWNWPRCFIGIHGHRFLLLPWALVIPYYAVLLATAVAESPCPVRLSPWKRLFAAALFFANLAFIFAVAYLSWHYPRMRIIWGVQARYLIPFAPLAFFALGALWPNAALRRVTAVAVPCLLACALAITLYLQIRIDYLPEENLIPNGTFAQWPEGAPLPDGWTIEDRPDEPPVAWSVSPIHDGSMRGGAGVEQTWHRSDQTDRASRSFGVTITGLRPRSLYRFYASVKGRPAQPVLVLAYAVKEDGRDAGRMTLLGHPAEIPGGLYHPRYEKIFVSGDSGSLRLIAICPNASEENPVSIIWDEWALIDLP